MTPKTIDLKVVRLRTGTPEIAIETDYGELDLHNFASFERFCFSPDGAARLAWVAYESNEFAVGSVPIERLIMTLLHVSCVTITSQDPEMPTSEDDQLEYFVVNEEPERSEPASLRILFALGNGRQIEIKASELRLSAITRGSAR